MGMPVVHWELMPEDPAKVSAFYEKIFGRKFEHVPDLSYRMVETGAEGGIGQPCFLSLLRKSHQLSAEGTMREYPTKKEVNGRIVRAMSVG